MLKFNVGDTLVMKKNHPCGSNKMQVIYAGSDIKIRCLGCSHDAFIQRTKLEKNIKQVLTGENHVQKQNP